MNITELNDLVSAKELIPVRVEGGAEKDGSGNTYFIGDIAGFLDAAKALGAKAVFISASALDEEQFFYDFNEGESDEVIELDDDEDVFEPVDLTVALPSLADFKKRIGTDYAWILSSRGGIAEISFYVEEIWWTEFEKLWTKAADIAEHNQAAVQQKMNEKTAEREKSLIAQMKSLLLDAEFLATPTQRGMRFVALEKMPELEVLREETLVREIQLLSDKIKGKGLNRLKKKG